MATAYCDGNRISYATESDLSSLEYTVDQLDSYVSQLGSNLERQISALDGRVSSHQSQLSQHDRQLGQLDSRLQSLQRELHGLRQELNQFRNDVEARLRQLQQTVDRMALALTRLAENADGIAAAVGETSDSTLRVTELIDESRGLIDQQSEQLQQDFERLASLQEALRAVLDSARGALEQEGERLSQQVQEAAGSGVDAVNRVALTVSEAGGELRGQVADLHGLWEEMSRAAAVQARRRQDLTEKSLSTGYGGNETLGLADEALRAIRGRVEEFQRDLEGRHAQVMAEARAGRLRTLTAAVAASRIGGGPMPGGSGELAGDGDTAGDRDTAGDGDPVEPLFEAVRQLPGSLAEATRSFGEYRARQARLTGAERVENIDPESSATAAWLREEAPRIVEVVLELRAGAASSEPAAQGDPAPMCPHSGRPPVARLLAASQHLGRRRWAAALPFFSSFRDLPIQLTATLSSCFQPNQEDLES